MMGTGCVALAPEAKAVQGSHERSPSEPKRRLRKRVENRLKPLEIEHAAAPGSANRPTAGFIAIALPAY